jgi:hypothetical protein
MTTGWLIYLSAGRYKECRISNPRRESRPWPASPTFACHWWAALEQGKAALERITE